MDKRFGLRGVLVFSLALSGLPACGDDSEDEDTEEVETDSGSSTTPDAGARDSGSSSGGSIDSGSSTGGNTDSGRPANGGTGTDSGSNGGARDSGTNTAADAGSTTAPKDIVDTALAAGSFGKLAAALTKAGLVETLKGAGPFTVFAPTDAAFTALGTAADSLTVEQLKTVLLYHVVGAKVLSTALTSGPVKTVSEFSAFVNVTPTSVKVNDATVTTADVQASNGVIHVIDKVLLPPNIVEAAGFDGRFKTLLSAATTAGLAGALSDEDAELTVFAPTDAAFAALPAGTVAGLSMTQLADVLKYHVVPSKVLSTQLTAGNVGTLLTGKNLTISLTGGVKVNDATVIVADVVTTNGVIHAVDKVLLPK
jgi:transforming growth factor-beta-induced protein